MVYTVIRTYRVLVAVSSILSQWLLLTELKEINKFI